MVWDVAALAPIGVEIRGLALGGTVSDDDLARLRRIAVDEGLVLLRDQALAPAAHVALGRRLGEIERGAFNEDTPDSDLILLTNRGRDGRMLPNDDVRMRLVAINEGWHTDSSFRPVPASFSLFSAVVVPPVGGRTFFACLRRGWEALDAPLREALRGRLGVHDYAAAFRRFGSAIEGDPIFDLPPVSHPLVRRHPESGATVLYTSEHVIGIEGMPGDEARALLARLLAVATAPDRVYAHAFRPGDLLIWDNRSMLHRAEGFDERHARVMHHVRIAGSEPVIAA
jgi:alpha-ketoglutarate-dependent 2,4-dichlorophenoxyacetate dioxygenase